MEEEDRKPVFEGGKTSLLLSDESDAIAHPERRYRPPKK